MEQEYIVQEGDNLSTILYNLTGDGSYANAQKVAEQNGISNPSHIEPGQTIRITTTNNQTATSPTSSETSTSSTNISSSSNAQPVANNSAPNISSSSRGVSRTNNASSQNVEMVAFDENSSSSTASAANAQTSTSANNDNNGIYTADAVKDGIKGEFSRDHQLRPRRLEEEVVVSQAPTSSEAASTQQTRGTTFSYGLEEDSIEYNVDDAINILVNGIDGDINNICDIISNIITTLNSLQKIAHDKENTNIAQDYKDFETIIGNDAEGLNGFVYDAYDVCVSIYNTLQEWQRITQK